MPDIQKISDALDKIEEENDLEKISYRQVAIKVAIAEAREALNSNPAPHGTDPTWEGPLAGDD